VTAGRVRVREKPSREARELDTLERGALLTMVGRSGDWLACKYGLRVGYVPDAEVLVL